MHASILWNSWDFLPLSFLGKNFGTFPKDWIPLYSCELDLHPPTMNSLIVIELVYFDSVSNSYLIYYICTYFSKFCDHDWSWGTVCDILIIYHLRMKFIQNKLFTSQSFSAKFIQTKPCLIFLICFKSQRSVFSLDYKLSLNDQQNHS